MSVVAVVVAHVCGAAGCVGGTADGCQFPDDRHRTDRAGVVTGVAVLAVGVRGSSGHAKHTAAVRHALLRGGGHPAGPTATCS